jgi:hypothetical protein
MNSNVQRPLYLIFHNFWQGAKLAHASTREKIAGFARLPDGWHYGSGSAPSDKVIQVARDLHDVLVSFGATVTDAFPGAEGEIIVTAYEGDRYVEVIVEADLTASIIYENPTLPTAHHKRLELREARDLLIRIAGAIWNTSDYSTRNTMTRGSAASLASHLGTLVATEAFQSSRVSAYMKEAYPSVHMSWNTTKLSSAIPFSSGASMREFYHRAFGSNNKPHRPAMRATTTS